MKENVNHKYHKLLKDILTFGHQKGDRTGTGTISTFGKMLEINMKDGFPLINTKFTWFHGIKHELLWFLQGDTNIKYLVENNVHIWDDWPYDNYLKFANSLKEPDYMYHMDDPVQNKVRPFTKKEFTEIIKNENNDFVKQFGHIGPGYGTQWVNWNNPIVPVGGGDGWDGGGINQIQQVIDDLKNKPDSRRIMVSAWNVAEIDEMTLPPCHYAFQLWTRELTFNERWEWYYNKKVEEQGHNLGLNHDHIEQEVLDGTPERGISLMWQQRSVDTFLGLPFNIASYALLLEMIAQQVDMIPLQLKANLGDTHIYLNHFEQVNEQLKNDPNKYPLPKLKLKKAKSIFDYKADDIQVDEYESFGKIKAPIAV